jgi:hypothetical protein
MGAYQESVGILEWGIHGEQLLKINGAVIRTSWPGSCVSAVLAQYNVLRNMLFTVHNRATLASVSFLKLQPF